MAATPKVNLPANKDARIAIIGAGISGLFTAIALKKKGFTNITLYEKGSRVANMTYTFAHDGHHFDFSTKVIPAIGLFSGGIYPPLMDLLNDVGVTVELAPVPRFFDFAKMKHMPIPKNMSKFGKIKVIRDFAKAYTLLSRISACSDFPEIYETGVVNAGETVTEWAARHKVEAFGEFTNYLVDFFNMGPAAAVPAVYVLVSRVHFMAPYLHALLSRAGVTHFYKIFTRKQDKHFHRFISYPAPKANYYVIREGYEIFFNRLVEKYNLDVIYNSHISGINAVNGSISYLVNRLEAKNCDRLIFCCPPTAIAELAHTEQIRRLFAGIRPGRMIRTWAFTATGWNRQAFGKSGYIIDGANNLGLGSPDFKANGELMYISKEYNDSELMVSPVYRPFAMQEKEMEQALADSLGDFNMKLTRIVAYKDFEWPNCPPLSYARDGWYETCKDLQGAGGVYYSGECLCGIGVPTILEHAGKFVQKYF